MNKIILCAAVAILCLASCASLTADETSARTPRRLLLDLKSIADSGRLDDIDEVGRRLGIALDSQGAEPVYDFRTGALQGYGIDVKPKNEAQLFYGDSFYYRVFRGVDGRIVRVLISIRISELKVCASEREFKDIFGRVQEYKNPHINYSEYVYRADGVNSIHSSFAFNLSTGCLFRAVISQN